MSGVWGQRYTNNPHNVPGIVTRYRHGYTTPLGGIDDAYMGIYTKHIGADQKKQTHSLFKKFKNDIVVKDSN